MKKLAVICCVVAIGVTWGPAYGDEGPGSASVLEPSEYGFDFELFDPGAPVEHTFLLKNSGNETIRLAKVGLTPPLQAKRFTAKIDPGAFGELVVSLGKPRRLGEYRGMIQLSFKNPNVADLLLQVRGKIEPVFEVKPFPILFLASQRGTTKSATLEVINRQEEPAELREARSDLAGLTVAIKTVEAGRRYELTASITSEAPRGKATGQITIETSSAKQPVLRIDAHIQVRERVYAFPDTIDFGRIEVADLKANPKLLDLLSQTVMVYQEGGRDFEVQPMTDLDELELRSTPSPLRDRYEVEVNLAPDRLHSGKIAGFVGLATNDPEFPILNIPVKGFVDSTGQR